MRFKTLLSTIILFSFYLGSFSQCAIPTAQEQLNINNVDATIRNGQRMWSNDGEAGYVVPKGEEVSSLYAGNFWIGGLTTENQLRLAGGTFDYMDISDYYAGPLNLSTAEVDGETCLSYDKIWVIYREEVEQHLAYWDCLQDPECDDAELFPFGYSIPGDFQDWPALGAEGQADILAPWFDRNLDGLYNPYDGDCPLFDFMLEDSDCEACDALKGDMCLYWIDNDTGHLHTMTQSDQIGVEIHNMAYAYASNGVLDNTTFYCKKIINRSTTNLYETNLGIWADVDLGGHVDDYVGCDINRNLGYGYNGDEYDDGTGFSDGYGENPPAVGVVILEGPLLDFDEEDNDNDGIVDNEKAGMSSYLYYNNATGLNGEPSTALDYFNYLTAHWKNGQTLSCGGDGLTSASGADLSSPTQWMFGDDTYPEGGCDEWTEVTAGNPPGDRRFLLSSGPFTFEAGEEMCIQYAVVWSRVPELVDLSSTDYLALSTDTIQGFHDECYSCLPPGVAIMTDQCGPYSYCFYNYGQGDIVEWDFGDGTTSTEENPIHDYGQGGEYEVTLTVTNDCGTTTGTVILFSVETGIEDAQPLNYNIYPNPTASELFIQTPDFTRSQVEVFDLTGRVVLKASLQGSGQIDVQGLSKGNYVLRVMDLQSSEFFTTRFTRM